MSAARKKPRTWRLPRAEWLGIITGALALGLMAVLTVLVVNGAQARRDDRAVIDALVKQVQGMGGTPVAGPTGSPGDRGEKGDKGDPGEPGADAPTITPSPGASGASGAPGKPGADSTVPGPAGPTGAAGVDSTVPGPSGPSGPPGPAGQNGTDGEDGAGGKPPAGWTFTYLGVTYTCQPADGFDESSPQYDCKPDRPGSNGNGDGSGTQAAALDPQRRQYI